MPLADTLGRWLGRVEVVLAGADDDLRDGEHALVDGDALRARAAAHRVLRLAPESVLGLALLADACEAAQLDAERALTLEELARRAPSRAEVWVRLGRARRATGSAAGDVRDAFVRAMGVAEAGSDARREALLELADLDLAAGDGARAELWLERTGADRSLDVATRLAEARLARGDAAGARALLDKLEIPPTDGRAALARGRALSALGEAGAIVPLLRAMVLDVPGASEALSSALGHVPTDPQIRARVRSVVDAKGEQELARWRAAFARAEGEREAARKALREAVAAGERAAALPLLEASVDDRDEASLAVALAALPGDTRDPLILDARRLPLDLGELARVRHPRLLAWAEARAEEAARALAPESAAADWPAVLARLDTQARRLADLEAVAAVAELSAERARPVRLAIVGEFNAGKSTFINALIGADVAPTGVLPTTATLHHLRWAPDPIARIFFALEHAPPERIVPLPDLRAALRSEPDEVRRVELHLPMPLLMRVEILDTPGFNAPDPRHTSVARGAFEEADAAIWLLDATQALKQSERVVLEEAKRARLPIQMLVNKADRLAQADLEHVMESVTAALADAGLSSWVPPVPLSAKKALAGKLGDAAALEASGWAAVQALLDDQLVGRAAELKERALRRRAASIAGKLADQAASNAAVQRSRAEQSAGRARAIGHLAAQIERRQDAVAGQLATSLEPAAAAWRADLALVFVGRGPELAVRDPAVARYRVERAVATLGPAVANALASLAPEAALTPSELTPVARALVRSAAAASPPGNEAPLAALAGAAIATLVEHLFARSVAPTEEGDDAGFVRELRAIQGAMS